VIPPEPTFGTIQDLIESWDVNWPLMNSDLTHAADIAAAISAGKAQACTDGLYMANLCKKLALAAWLIEHKEDWRIVCSGHTPVLGLPVDVNAYRVELHGIHVALMVIKAICIFYGITQGSVDLFCECDMALWLASKEWLQLVQLTKHADIVRAICILVDELPIKIWFREVKGHQDNHVEYALLDRPSQMNMEADCVAKAYLCRLI